MLCNCWCEVGCCCSRPAPRQQSALCQQYNRQLAEHVEWRLQGYQSCTQACGLLCMVEPRDAFLTSLCTFTLSLPDAAGPQERSGSLSPPPKGASTGA